MKICINLLAASAGGQLTRSRAFLKRFQTYADGAELIVVKGDTALEEITSKPGMPVINVPLSIGNMKALHRTFWENTILPQVIRRHSADVYLTFSHYLPTSVGNLIPSVVGVSNLAPFSNEAWKVESRLAKVKMFVLQRSILASCNRASHVLALSGTCRDIIVARGVLQEKVSVITNGVDEDWSEIGESTGLAQRLGISRLVILYVSHFHRYKNHHRLIEAYSKIDINLRNAHQLVLVGNPYDLSYYNELREMANQLKLENDVIFVPGLDFDRLRELYHSTKLFVFPSLIENCPNILLEAMMAGIPVSVSCLLPMPEFCGDAAVYFDPLDSNSITRSIEGVLTDVSRLVEMRMLSKNRALGYSWNYFVPRVIDCCRSVAAQVNY